MDAFAGEYCFSIPGLYTIIGIVAIIFVMLMTQFIQERDMYKSKYYDLLNTNNPYSISEKNQKSQKTQKDENDGPFRENIYLDNRINIPTQGEYTSWHQVGVLRQKVVTDPEQMMPLMGRKLDRNNWEYYTTNHLNTSLKIPIEQSKEFYDGDELSIPGYNGLFVVEIYDYDKPRYIPYF